MGAYKDLLIGVQELIWTAVEIGARDADTVYAYVIMYEPKATYDLVENMLIEMFGSTEAEYYENINPGYA
jgi:hypothetical protein